MIPERVWKLKPAVPWRMPCLSPGFIRDNLSSTSKRGRARPRSMWGALDEVANTSRKTRIPYLGPSYSQI